MLKHRGVRAKPRMNTASHASYCGLSTGGDLGMGAGGLQLLYQMPPGSVRWSLGMF